MDAGHIHGGEQIDVSAQQPTLLLRDSTLPGVVELEGEHVTVERIDDWREVVQASTPSGNQQLASYNHRNETLDRYDGEKQIRVLGFTEPNSTLLVNPLDRDTEMTTSHRGTYSVEPSEDRLLEHSHYASPNSTENPQYYEYRAKDKLAMGLEGENQLNLEGAFELYLWGARVEVVGDNGTVYETGHWAQDRSEGTNTVREEHFVFARIRMSNSHLSMSLDQPRQLTAFADTFQADLASQSKATFEDAQGVLSGPDSAYRSEGGTMSAQDGTYRWSYDGENIETTAIDPPFGVDGGEAVSTASDGLSWWWALAPLVAIAALVGARRGRLYVDTARAWLRERRVQRWTQAGDRLTSVRDYASAHEYYNRITEAYPEISEAWYSKGVVLQEMGRHAEAADAFVEAHESIQEDEPEMIEMAACEAWRAGDEEQARELFERLGRLDPIRLRRRLDEPDFADVGDQPWVRELLGLDEDAGVQYA